MKGLGRGDQEMRLDTMLDECFCSNLPTLTHRLKNQPTIPRGTPCLALRQTLRKRFQAGTVLILVVTENSPQSLNNKPWDIVNDCKMLMHCNPRGQKKRSPNLITEGREEEDQSWHLLPWPWGLVLPCFSLSSITVPSQVLALEKVGQGRPALRGPPFL